MDVENQQISNQQSSKRKSWRRLGCCVGLFVIIITILAIIAFGARVWSIKKQVERGELPESVNQQRAADSPVAKLIDVITDDDPGSGPKDAKAVIVEFASFDCPVCRGAYPVIREILAIYGGRIRFIYRDFPVSEAAQKAAEAAGCADDQEKFWPMHDKLFQNQSRLTVNYLKSYAQQIGLDQEKFAECLDSGKYSLEVKKDFSDGMAAGVDGTPTWFINGQKVESIIPLETFKRIIDSLLAQ